MRGWARGALIVVVAFVASGVARAEETMARLTGADRGAPSFVTVAAAS